MPQALAADRLDRHALVDCRRGGARGTGSFPLRLYSFGVGYCTLSQYDVVRYYCYPGNPERYQNRYGLARQLHRRPRAFLGSCRRSESLARLDCRIPGLWISSTNGVGRIAGCRFTSTSPAQHQRRRRYRLPPPLNSHRLGLLPRDSVS